MLEYKSTELIKVEETKKSAFSDGEVDELCKDLKVTKDDLLELGFILKDNFYVTTIIDKNDKDIDTLYLGVIMNSKDIDCSVDLYDGKEDFLCELKEGLPTKSNLVVLINALKGI